MQPALGEIVLDVLTVGVSDRLSHLCANTPAERRCADKPRQAIALAQLRPQRTPRLVYAGGHGELFAPLRLVQMVLQ